MTKEQIIYNRVIDNLTYLILNYPKPVQELLSHHNVFFKGKPSKAQLINEVVQLISLGNERFSNAIEQLITRFSAQENDAFWGALAKGAIGIVGGLLSKKKRRRSSGGNSGAAQAAAAKRDMELRMAQMREAQERREREAERRRQEEARRQEELRRRREEKKAAEEKAAAEKKTLYLIFGGIIVVGLGIAVVVNMKSKPAMPVYGQMPRAMPPISAPIQ